MCSSGTAAAVDESDSDWVIPEWSINYASYNTATVDIYGTSTRYVLDSEGNGLYDYTRDQSTSYNFLSSNTSNILYQTSSTNKLSYINLPLPSGVTSAPYNHYESDEKTYYTLYEYPMISVSSTACWFYTDLYLDPGFYEMQIPCSIDGKLVFPNSQYSIRPVFFEVGLYQNGRATLISKSSADFVRMTIEVKERSRVYFGASFPTYVDDYNVNVGGQSCPYLRFLFNQSFNNPLKYRQVDPLEVTALEAANTDAQNSLQQSNELESQWVGSMSENFAALDLANFSWDSGLVGAFSLISDIFMRLWAAMGKYNILYVFPLTLGVVLLLIGRLSRTSVKRSSGRGDDDA